MTGAWPWLALVGLGAFHGLNPAMGWLFAVALGLHRGSRAVVLLSLVPIALGHALAIAIAVVPLIAAGVLLDLALLRRLAGIVLVAWALYHLVWGARHRVRVGMQTGFAGLVLWSFLMAGGHGAGLMLLPVLIPLCLAGGANTSVAGSLPTALAAIAVHSLATLAVTGVVASVVYDWVGVGFLRRGWVNLDLLWSAALLATGLVLLVL
jgi:hypothetical protein